VTAALDDLTGALDELDAIFGYLEPLAAQFAAVAADPSLARRALHPLRPVIQDLLEQHRGWLAGAGVICAPGLLRDVRHWMDWWFTGPDGTPNPLRVNLDEQSVEFFDYTEADWYAVPMRTGRAFAAGPYVDYLCTNEYSLTLAVPVRAGDTLVGVAAADILVATVEGHVIAPLRAVSPQAVLCTPAGRVVASATPEHAPGERIDLATAAASSLPRTSPDATRWLLLR